MKMKSFHHPGTLLMMHLDDEDDSSKVMNGTLLMNHLDDEDELLMNHLHHLDDSSKIHLQLIKSSSASSR